MEDQPGFVPGATDQLHITFNDDERERSIPEPATLALFGTALAGLGLLRRRRKNA